MTSRNRLGLVPCLALGSQVREIRYALDYGFPTAMYRVQVIMEDTPCKGS